MVKQLDNTLVVTNMTISLLHKNDITEKNTKKQDENVYNYFFTFT